MINILFLTAEPTDTCRLRLGKEHKEIQEQLLRQARRIYKLDVRMSSRPTDITQAIFDTNPQIVHFSGHGTDKGEICFEDENGLTATIPLEVISSLFKLSSKKVDCVILNACYSKPQAEKIADSIKYVIGMNKSISDKAAIKFSVGFYRALGNGLSIEEAFEYGKLELQLLKIPEEDTPELIHRSKSKTKNEKQEEVDQEIEVDFTVKVKQILKDTKLNVRGYNVPVAGGFGGLSTSYKLDTTDIDNAVAKLTRLNNNDAVFEVLEKIIGNQSEDINDCWKAVEILTRFNTPKGLKNITTLFKRLATGVKNETLYLHESCLRFINGVKNNSSKELKRESLEFAVMNCPTVQTRINALKLIVEASKINDDKVINLLISIADEESDAGLRRYAASELEKFNLRKYILPITDWLSEIDLNFRKVVASKIAMKYYSNLDFYEVSEIFHSEIDRDQKQILGDILLKINKGLAEKFVVSTLRAEKDENTILVLLSLCNKYQINDAQELIDEFQDDDSYSQQVKNMAQRYVQTMERLCNSRKT